MYIWQLITVVLLALAWVAQDVYFYNKHSKAIRSLRERITKLEAAWGAR